MSGDAEIFPLTLEELKEPLTEDERTELENPYFFDQLMMFIEAVNNFPNLSKDLRGTLTEQLRWIPFRTRETFIPY